MNKDNNNRTESSKLSISSSNSNPRSTLSIGVGNNLDLLDRAMRNIESSSRNKNSTKDKGLDSRLSQMSKVLLDRDKTKENSELDVFDRSFEKLQQENKSRVKNDNLTKDNESPVSDNTELEPTALPYNASEVVKVKEDIRYSKKKGSKFSEEKSQEPSKFVKKEKSKSSRLSNNIEAKFDEIDVHEYEMLYGGSIIVKSPTLGGFNAPRKRVRESSNLSSSQSNRATVEKFVSFYDGISVKDLSIRMKLRSAVLLKTLLGLGVKANINLSLDHETVELLCADLGYECKIELSDVDKKLNSLMKDFELNSEGETRPPLVTIMGHVDHGKTSLLDYIRRSNVTVGESGGITQHIGAYMVNVETKEGKRKICFVDTPGHSAFSAMRSRGAKITDIAALVIAADDGIMTQTTEAINHIKAAGVPMIVVINKIDKPEVDIEKIKSELAKLDVIAEDYGGDVPIVGVSAKTGENVSGFLESIILQADIMDLKADKNASTIGTVIESRIDKNRGPIATLLVQNGSLRNGDIVASISGFGKVKRMIDDQGNSIDIAGPSVPVEVMGFNSVPSAGDRFLSVTSEKEASEIFEIGSKRLFNSGRRGVARDSMFDQKKKELNIIIKGDVSGSIEAIASLLSNINSKEIDINIISKGVGVISSSDISLMGTTGGIICGFKVNADENAKKNVPANVDIRLYDVIYDLESDIKEKVIDIMSLEVKETKLGSAIIRKVFQISKVGIVAGCYVQSGSITSSALIKVIRGSECIGESKISSLKSVNLDSKEITTGHECGIKLLNNIEIQVGDTLESFSIERIRPSID